MTSFLEHWAMSQNSWCILDAPLQSLKICGALHLFANLDVIFDLFPFTPPPPPQHTHTKDSMLKNGIIQKILFVSLRKFCSLKKIFL